MATVGVDIEVLDGTDYGTALDDLSELLVDAVASGASVSFLGGLDRDRARAWWAQRAELVAAGQVRPVVARREGRIVGVVLLILSTTENAPYRAEIAKMLVHRSARRQGIATRLLTQAEELALGLGRSLLLLDTVTDSPAERLYAGLGWQRLGSVPAYALNVDGTPEAATFMWKDLRAASNLAR